MNGSKYVNSILGKVVSTLLALIFSSYAVNKCNKLNTVTSVVEYEIQSGLPDELVENDQIKAEMKP